MNEINMLIILMSVSALLFLTAGDGAFGVMCISLIEGSEGCIFLI
jgi:hypothetical protein